VSELNHLSLGQQLGELTQAIRGLTERVSSLESNMKDTQGIFAMGKGAVFGLVLAGAMLINGAASALGKLWDWVR
jgi:hypothetical protein